MSERAQRTDAGGLISLAIEDCAFCGADCNLAGGCSARCEMSRRAEMARADEKSRRVARTG